MSKVVKSVGRAISKVVKGVAKAVRKVAQSKLGRVLIGAAAIYFGGAALMGAMGTSGAAAAGGLSGLSGAAANIGAAWSSLGTAGSALMGGNLSGAGSAVASGFTGTAAGGSALAGAAGTAVGTAAAAPTVTGAATGATTGATVGAGAGAGTAAGAGSLGQGLIGAAKINAATQLVGGVVQGAGQQKAMEDQRNYDQQQAQAARDRYNQNVGTTWWGDGGTGSTGDTGAGVAPATAGSPGLVAGAMPGGPAPGQSYKDYMDNLMKSYNPYALPTRV